MGFSAFSGGGRFEALRRTGPGRRRRRVQVSGLKPAWSRWRLLRRARGPRAGRAGEEGRSRRHRPCRLNRPRSEVSALPGSRGDPRGPRRRPCRRWLRSRLPAASPGPGKRPSPRRPPPSPSRRTPPSLTHFAAQAVIWRQRRRPELWGAGLVFDASKL